MEKKINKCASAIIDGLGYEIISDKGRIIGFQDKESQKVFGRSGGDSYFNSYELKDGLKAKIYHDDNMVVIEFPNNTKIRIEESAREQFVNISIEYNITPGNETHVSIDFTPSSNSKEGHVIGASDFYGIRPLARIHANDDEDKWHSFEGNNYEKKSHEASDLTSEKIMELLEDCFKNYNNGDEWNDDLKNGLKVITPAINIITAYFKKSWATRLNNRIIANTKQYNKNKSEISTAESEIKSILNRNGEIYNSSFDTRNAVDQLLKNHENIDPVFKESRAGLLSKLILLDTQEYFSNESKIANIRAEIANIDARNASIFDINFRLRNVADELLSDPVIAKLYEKKPESQWRKTGEN